MSGEKIRHLRCVAVFFQRDNAYRYAGMLDRSGIPNALIAVTMRANGMNEYPTYRVGVHREDYAKAYDLRNSIEW